MLWFTITLNYLKKTWGKIEKKIKENFIFFDIVNELDGMFDFKMIKKLFDQYHSKEMIFQKLSEDPYRCLCEISRIGFKRADELLLKAEEYFSSKGKKAPIKFYEDPLPHSGRRFRLLPITIFFHLLLSQWFRSLFYLR